MTSSGDRDVAIKLGGYESPPVWHTVSEPADRWAVSSAFLGGICLSRSKGYETSHVLRLDNADKTWLTCFRVHGTLILQQVFWCYMQCSTGICIICGFMRPLCHCSPPRDFCYSGTLPAEWAALPVYYLNISNNDLSGAWDLC